MFNVGYLKPFICMQNRITGSKYQYFETFYGVQINLILRGIIETVCLYTK